MTDSVVKQNDAFTDGLNDGIDVGIDVELTLGCNDG